MNVLFGTANAFAPNYWFFLVGACGCGFSAIGSGTVAYCWMMEMLSGKVAMAKPKGTVGRNYEILRDFRSKPFSAACPT